MIFTIILLILSSIVFGKLICYLFDIHNNRSWLVVTVILLIMNLITLGINGAINSTDSTSFEEPSDKTSEITSE